MDLEWVEIKKGEFVPGFTEAQKQQIRAVAYAELDFEQWTEQEYALFEEFVTKYEQYWDKSLPPSPYPRDLDDALFTLEIKNEELPGFFAVVRTLATLETALQRVKMKQFYITRYPVTVKQFTPFFERIKHKLKRKEILTFRLDEEITKLAEEENGPEPVKEQIAIQFCEWVGGRLPTSYEWEYAARGPAGFLYPWGDSWGPERANFGPSLPRAYWKKEARQHVPSAVDAYPEGVSPFGVWDMVGNVQEYVDGWANKKLFSCKGPSPREVHEPVWFWYLPGLDNDCEVLPGYSGFRVVKDKWQPQSWPGFKKEVEG